MIPLDADRLFVFAEVARERGFSRAARVLGKTQSAVSQAVIQLEHELGAPLFVRDGRTTRLTEAGSTLLEHADRIFSEMNAARERVAALRDLEAGALSIGTSDTLACHLLPPVFRAFRQWYPGIEIRLENRPSPESARAVAERRVDLGVVVLPLTEPRATMDRLRVTELVPHVDKVICPPTHPLAHRKRVAPKDLAKEPLLLLDRTTGSRAYVDRAFEGAGIRPRVSMETRSVDVLVKLVELGFGISVVPEIAVREDVSRGAVVALEFASGGPRRHAGLVTPVGSPVGRAAQAFVDTLLSELPSL